MRHDFLEFLESKQVELMSELQIQRSFYDKHFNLVKEDAEQEILSHYNKLISLSGDRNFELNGSLEEFISLYEGDRATRLFLLR